MTAAPTDLADRYGAPRPGRRIAIISVVVVLVAGLAAVLGWSIWSSSHPDVSSDLVGFEVTGQHSVVAHVVVDLADEDVEATCTLRAYAEDHTVVGELSFTPSGSGRLEETVRTEREATSVDLLGCTTADQKRPG